MSTSTVPCPICKQPAAFAGTAPLKTRGEPVQTQFYRCRACDFFYRELTEESFMENNEVAHYSNLDFADFYRNQRFEYFNLLIDLIQKRMRVGKDDGGERRPRMLDVGCAYGHLVEVANDRGFDAVGVEINAGNREHARSNGVTVEDSLDKFEGEFDVVTIIDALYYVMDPVPFLKEIFERLRPGGFVLARVTNRNLEARWRCFRSESADLRIFVDHTSGYSPRAMRRLLRASGYIDAKVLSESGRAKELSKKSKRIYRQTGFLAALTFDKIILTPGLYGLGYKPL